MTRFANWALRRMDEVVSVDNPQTNLTASLHYPLNLCSFTLKQVSRRHVVREYTVHPPAFKVGIKPRHLFEMNVLSISAL